MNVKFLKNVQRNIVINNTPSYAIAGVNFAYTVSINMQTNCKISIK